MPRYYSIASSPLANPDRVAIALTVVETAIGPFGVVRRGLCTNWLDTIVQPLVLARGSSALTPAVAAASPNALKIPIYLRSTRDFRPPVSHESPLLLIGPGTGVAPFIGFLQHRYLEVRLHSLLLAHDLCCVCESQGD